LQLEAARSAVVLVFNHETRNASHYEILAKSGKKSTLDKEQLLPSSPKLYKITKKGCKGKGKGKRGFV